MARSPRSPAGSTSSELRALARLFLRLGSTAFGGPAAHIALLEDEVVRRRRWLTRERFLDMLGATNLIPGPNSTEMAIHVGYDRAGAAGLVVAGACFIGPAALVTLALAWAYVRFGTLPEASAFLDGAKAAIIAVVLQALWRLSRTAVRSWRLALVGVLVLAAAVWGVHEVTLIFVTGAALAVVRRATDGRSRRAAPALVAGAVPLGFGGTAAVTAVPFTLGALFLFFLKVGAILFGSGYVLLAFLRADLVERWRWLTNEQLLDAIAVGQLTPGPVFTTATFIGYVLGGGLGALVATVGIFLPAFIFVAVTGPLLPHMRRSTTAAAFLDGVNVASLAVLALVTGRLALTAITDWVTGSIAVAVGGLLLASNVNAAWLVLGGGCVTLAVRSVLS